MVKSNITLEQLSEMNNIERRIIRQEARERYRQQRDVVKGEYERVLFDLYPDPEEFKSGDKVKIIWMGKEIFGTVDRFSLSLRSYMVWFEPQMSRRFYADEMELVEDE